MSMHVKGLRGSSADQAEKRALARTAFGAMLDKALKGISEPTRAKIDTPEGACVCFFGDPEDALQSALLLRGLLTQKYGKALSIRIGLHLGPLRVVPCASGAHSAVTVLGDGFNVAQRITDFAQPNQIVVSRVFYDLVSGLTDLGTRLFDPLGTHMDTHLRAHDLFALLEPQAVVAKASASAAAFDHTATFPSPVSLTAEMASEIEQELAMLIGPLAAVLVKKAAPRVISARALRELLSASIADLPARAAFLTPIDHPRHQNSA